jgi:AcrR family transcriptional regulator
VPVEQLRSQQRHQRILDAATRVFATKGYHGTLVDEIAIEAATSKGGVYFHFPNKQAIFLALFDRLAELLRSRVESAVAAESTPVARAEAALRTVLETFASHRRLSRLCMVEALGAGPEFTSRMLAIRTTFAELIRVQLDAAVTASAIPPLDTVTASYAWFGAVNEVVLHWALADRPWRLEDDYPTIRVLLLRSIQAEDVPAPRLASERSRAG